MSEVTYAYERAWRLITDTDVGLTVDLVTLAPSVGGTPAFFDGCSPGRSLQRTGLPRQPP